MSNLENGIYEADRLPFEAGEERRGDHFQTAESIVRRCHGAISQAQTREPAAPKPRGGNRLLARPVEAHARAERLAIFNEVRPVEAAALRTWAEEAGLMRDGAEFFRHWDAQGSMSGAEHAVYFDEESQRWVKTNNLYFHSHWLEYIHRMLLHNWLFPSVAYRLEGFIEFSPWPESGMPEVFQPLVSQPHVRALRGASRAEVVRELDRRAVGWVRNDNYRSFDGGLLVEDLHDENALVIDESETDAPAIAFIDPVLFLTPDTKLARLRKSTGDS